MIKNLLEETEAFMEGHFLLSSGKHSDGYVQCAKLLMYPDKAEEATEKIVEQLEDVEFDIVVGPAMGGVIPSYELARQVNKPAIFVERKDGEMKLRRGFTIRKGMKAIVAEDVVTTGKSCMEAIKVIEELGAEVVGVTCLVDRGESNLDYPLYSATKLNLNVYDEKDCPMCKENMEITQPGSRDMKKK